MILRPQNVFDSQLAAAFCGYGDQISYAALVERVVGIRLAKSHTRVDWSKRPLSSGELKYAMDDVVHLFALRDHLAEQLASLGRTQWFTDECAGQNESAYWSADPTQAWQRLKGTAALPAEAQETAKQLAIWREQEAIQRDRLKEWILSTSTLLTISQRAPDSLPDLRRIGEMSGKTIKRHGDVILQICRHTPRDCEAKPLWSAKEALDSEEKKRVKAIMARIREVAEALHLISPSLLANRHSIEQFVRGNMAQTVFEGWRYE